MYDKKCDWAWGGGGFYIHDTPKMVWADMYKFQAPLYGMITDSLPTKSEHPQYDERKNLI